MTKPPPPSNGAPILRRNGSNGSNGRSEAGGREEVDERGCSALAAVSLHPPFFFFITLKPRVE